MKGGPLLPIRWPQARWRVSCVPQGACLLMRGEWYWAISCTEGGWSPLADRWCIGHLGENGRCTQVLIDSFCSGAELHDSILHRPKGCTAHRVMPYPILLKWDKSVVSAHAEVARYVSSGGHSHSCGHLHSSAYRLNRYCTGHGVYAFHRFIPYLGFFHKTSLVSLYLLIWSFKW